MIMVLFSSLNTTGMTLSSVGADFAEIIKLSNLRNPMMTGRKQLNADCLKLLDKGEFLFAFFTMAEISIKKPDMKITESSDN